jgi:Na+/proline symporter
MHWIDITIIVTYLLVVCGFGLWLSRRASSSIEDYFLGGRSIPWFILGISGMANFIDMGGTAYQSGWYFLVGAKGFWLCVEGAVALLLSFQMVYVAKWLRRSNVMTNAEWMLFRFGDKKHGQLARITSAASALVICVGLMCFFFEGAGKVLVEFLPIAVEEKIELLELEKAERLQKDDTPTGIAEQTQDARAERMKILRKKIENAENLAGLAFFVLVGIYTVASGFFGVIYTDLLQAFLIAGLILFVGCKAFAVGTPEYFSQHASPEWTNLFSDGGWRPALPDRFAELKGYAEKANWLGLLVIFWIMNNVFQGMATPFDAWTAQRYYAARNERESCLIPCEWIVLWSLRFFLMAGIGVLALGVADQIEHPEKALSVVIQEVIPIGLRGLLLAALLAAGMSTIDSTANSSASYFVKDIYQPYLKPGANRRHLVRVSYGITILLMSLGVVIGWGVENISAIWGWIIMGLFTGTLPPNILKWFWWRTNGLSFALGTLAGVGAALATQLIGGLPAYASYLVVFGAGLAASILGTFLGEPVERSALVRFYEKTRPFGIWGAVRRSCRPQLVADARAENRNDLIALPFALVCHFSLFLGVSSILFKDWRVVGICFAVAILAGLGVYAFWYRNLPPVPAEPTEQESGA